MSCIWVPHQRKSWQAAGSSLYSSFGQLNMLGQWCVTLCKNCSYRCSPTADKQPNVALVCSGIKTRNVNLTVVLQGMLEDCQVVRIHCLTCKVSKHMVTSWSIDLWENQGIQSAQSRPLESWHVEKTWHFVLNDANQYVKMCFQSKGAKLTHAATNTLQHIYHHMDHINIRPSPPLFLLRTSSRDIS